MTQPFSNIFWQIMQWGCSNPIKGIFHPIQQQQANQDIPYQLPEPWNGDIEKAPVIFVGLNPSFDPNEFFPHDDSSNTQPWWTTPAGCISLCGANYDLQRLEDFFENRFSNPCLHKPPYVNNNLGVLLNNLSYSHRVKYWSFIEKVMRFELNTPQAKMGVDCALLEIVPCKSKNCAGISSVINQFVPNLFLPLLQLILANNANDELLFVVFGEQSSKEFYKIIKQLDPNFASSYKNANHLWNSGRCIKHTAIYKGKSFQVLFSRHPSWYSIGNYKNRIP